jgi:hypothetical protein
MTYQVTQMAISVEPTVEPTEGSQRQVDGRAGAADEENRRQGSTTDHKHGSWMRSLDRLLCLSFALVSPPYLFSWFPPPDSCKPREED